MTTKTKASAIKVIADTLATEIGNKYSDEFINIVAEQCLDALRKKFQINPKKQ